MGIGPVFAIPKALKVAGLTLDQIGVIELNEAFAAQSLAVIKEARLDLAKVNPNGGAIALGHPLGCTGAKLTATLLRELKRRNERYGMVSMAATDSSRSIQPSAPIETPASIASSRGQMKSIVSSSPDGC